MDKEVYMKNLWNKYQQTKDLKFLIKACENAPFFGNPEMGKKIAKIWSCNSPYQYQKITQTRVSFRPKSRYPIGPR